MLGCHALLWGKKDGHTGAHALQRTRVVALVLQSQTTWPGVTVGLSGYLNEFGESCTWV